MKPRLLANENFPAPSVTALRDAGFDVLDLREDGGSTAPGPAPCGSGCRLCAGGCTPHRGGQAEEPGAAARRAWADRLAPTLVNPAQLDARAFVEREGGAVLLEDDARKAVVVAYQERKQEDLTHPLLAESVPLSVVPLVQGRLLARHVRGEAGSDVPFAMR